MHKQCVPGLSSGGGRGGGGGGGGGELGMRLVFVVLCKSTGSHPALVDKIWKISF